MAHIAHSPQKKQKYSHVYMVQAMTGAAITRSILAPLERLKITMQVLPVEKSVRDMSRLDFLEVANKISVDQGLMSFWRGNSAMVYKACLVQFSNLYLFAKMRNLLGDDSSPFFASLAVSVATHCALYPLDLAHCLMGADMSMKTGSLEDEGTS